LVPIRAGPDQLHAFLTFHLDQGGVDRSGEARVVQLDREIAAAEAGDLLPGGAELDRAGVDAEVRALVGGVLDAFETSLDVEIEGLDRTREAACGRGEDAGRNPRTASRGAAFRTRPACAETAGLQGGGDLFGHSPIVRLDAVSGVTEAVMC